MASRLIRSSLHLQKLKFGRAPEPLENSISSSIILKKACELGIDTVGIRLSFAENRALHAVQKLLDGTDYAADDRLEISISQYLDAFGVKKSVTARRKNEYGSRSRSAALAALNRLEGNVCLIAYDKVTWPGGRSSLKRMTERVEYTGSLIRTERDGNRLCITSSRVLTDQIDRHFCWLPADLYQGQLSGSEISKPLLIEYLNYTYDTERKRRRTGRYTMTYTMETWARKLRMDSLIEARQYGRIRRKLLEAYELGKQLGYLKDYQIDQPGVRVACNDVLTLDIDMMARMRSAEDSSKVYHETSQSLP